MPASNLHCNWFYIISIVGLNVTALRTKGNILTDLWPMWALGAALLSIDKKLGKQLAAWRGRTSSPPHHSTSGRLSPAVIRQILVDIMWVDTHMCLGCMDYTLRREMLIGAFKPLFQVDCSGWMDGHVRRYTMYVLRTFVLFVTVCLGHLVLYIYL